MEQHESEISRIAVVLCVLLGAITTIVTLNRRELFPEQYAHHHIEAHVEAKTADHHTESETTVKEDHTLAEDSSKNVLIEKTEAETTYTASVSAEKHSEPVGHAFILIAASFRSEDNAQRFLEEMKEKADLDAAIIKADIGPETFYRVVSHNSSSWKEIVSAREKLQNAGYMECWIAEK